MAALLMNSRLASLTWREPCRSAAQMPGRKAASRGSIGACVLGDHPAAARMRYTLATPMPHALVIASLVCPVAASSLDLRSQLLQLSPERQCCPSGLYRRPS